MAKPRSKDLRPVTEQRVSQIAEMMASGRWLTRVSASQLAAEWKCSDSRVRQLAAEASRRLTDDFPAERRETLRAMLFATLDNVRARARTKTRRRHRSVREGEGQGRLRVVEWEEPSPDFDAEIRATELQARLFGLLRPDVDVTMISGAQIGQITAGVVLLPAETEPQSFELVETSGEEVEPKKLNGGNGHGGNGGSR